MTAQTVEQIQIAENGTQAVLRIRETRRAAGMPREQYNDYQAIAEELMDALGIEDDARVTIRTWVRSGVAGVIRAAEAAEHRPTGSPAIGPAQQAARERANGNVTAHSQAGRQAAPQTVYDLLGVYILEIGKRFGEFTIEDHEVRYRSHATRHQAHGLSMRSHRWAQQQIRDSGVVTLYDIPREDLEPQIPEWLRP